jgi:tagaturonate epimerase
MNIEKFSFGTGDRFGKEGSAQLQAIQEINRLGVPVVPVWNKSNREHLIIGSLPSHLEKEATAAVAKCRYTGNYYTDADHINLDTVDRFLDSCNFFTLDVAGFIAKSCSEDIRQDFMARHMKYLGDLIIPGIDKPFTVTREFLDRFANHYLTALEEVGKIYKHLCNRKGEEGFITEVSIDETDLPQTPLELFFILSELNAKGVALQTLAPRFSGLFAKGIDYIGNLNGFQVEFEQDLAVLRYAADLLGLPAGLKLSVHSGSDKFSLYPLIRLALRKTNAGIHVKTAGTTWLEEVIGLAESGREGLEIAKEIYCQSVIRFDELTAPYASVLHLDRLMLPGIAEVEAWTGRQFSEALTHDQRCKNYNPQVRQLVHVGYKVAAEMGDRFLSALDKYRDIIEQRVKHNLLERHLKPLFLENG